MHMMFKSGDIIYALLLVKQISMNLAYCSLLYYIMYSSSGCPCRPATISPATSLFLISYFLFQSQLASPAILSAYYVSQLRLAMQAGNHKSHNFLISYFSFLIPYFLFLIPFAPLGSCRRLVFVQRHSIKAFFLLGQYFPDMRIAAPPGHAGWQP